MQIAGYNGLMKFWKFNSSVNSRGCGTVVNISVGGITWLTSSWCPHRRRLEYRIIPSEYVCQSLVLQLAASFRHWTEI